MAKRRLADAKILRRYHPHMRAFLRERGLGHRRFRATAVSDLRLRSTERYVQEIRSGKRDPPPGAERLSISDLRRRVLFADLEIHPHEDFEDLYLLQEKRRRAARRVRIPDEVVDVHAHHIRTFSKLNGIEGRPFTAVAKENLRPDSIETEVRKRAESASGRVNLNALRRSVIHERMGVLHDMGGLVGVKSYRTRAQIPEHIRRQHNAYIEACLRDMKLEGRKLRVDARAHLSPVSIENEAMRLQLGADTRRLADIRVRGVENETDMNQLRMNIIAKRMQWLHSQRRLVTRT